MALWLVFAVMILAVLAFLLAPLLGRGAPETARAEFDLQVYRDQLRELDTDLERGLLSGEEADAARIEVERRMLRAGDAGAKGAAAPRLPWQQASAALLAIALPVSAVALYGGLGRPELPGQPLAGRVVEAPMVARQQSEQPAGEVGQMVARLAERLNSEPDDYLGWMMLGRSYAVMQRHADSLVAYRHAAMLPEAATDATVHSSLGEALVIAADGVVTPAAAGNFHQAVTIDPGDPGGRYYLALARVQAGDLQAGFDGWLALAKDSPADAPWLEVVRTKLRQVAAELGIDLDDYLPVRPTATVRADPPARGPSAEDVAAARDMSADDRMAMVRSMVQRLAERLAQAPDDFDGWIRLGRSYQVLGEAIKSRDAYSRATALRPDDVVALTGLAGAAIAAEGGAGALPAAAMAAYRKVLALDGANPDALWFLGEDDARRGQPEAALAKWRRLAEHLPADGPERAELDRRIEALKAATGAE